MESSGNRTSNSKLKKKSKSTKSKRKLVATGDTLDVKDDEDMYEYDEEDNEYIPEQGEGSNLAGAKTSLAAKLGFLVARNDKGDATQ